MKTLLLGFLLLATLSVPAAWKRLTCGFHVAKMQLDRAPDSRWTTPPLDAACRERIFSQPFSYLARGAQCYVFASSDKELVLKIFRYDRQSKTPDEKLERLFRACLLAAEKAPEETGLIGLHLNQTTGEWPILHARGPLGQPLHIPLDRYRFVLQRRALPLPQVLREARQNPVEMRERLDALLQLLRGRIAKGIGNSDLNLNRNFGFLEGRAIELDFGNFFPLDGAESEARERDRCRRGLTRWLRRNAPEWVSYAEGL